MILAEEGLLLIVREFRTGRRHPQSRQDQEGACRQKFRVRMAEHGERMQCRGYQRECGDQESAAFFRGAAP